MAGTTDVATDALKVPFPKATTLRLNRAAYVDSSELTITYKNG